MTDDLPTPCRPAISSLALSPVFVMPCWHVSFHLVFGRPLRHLFLFQHFPQCMCFISSHHKFNNLSVNFFESCTILFCSFLRITLHMHSVYTVGVHDIMIGCLFGVYNVGIHISLLVFVYKLCCLLSLVFMTHDWVFVLGVYNVGIQFHVLLWGIHRLWCPPVGVQDSCLVSMLCVLMDHYWVFMGCARHGMVVHLFSCFRFYRHWKIVFYHAI